MEPSPDRTYAPPPLDDARVASLVAAWTSAPVCGPLSLTLCEATGARVMATFDSETASVDVFDGTTHAWVGGWWLTDAVDDGPCPTQVWQGDLAHKPCADEALAWVGQRQHQGCYAWDTDTDATCDVATCVRDELGAGG